MENVKKELLDLFTKTAVLYDKPITNDLIQIYVEAFKSENLTIIDLINSLKIHLKTGKFFPKPVDLIELAKKNTNQNLLDHKDDYQIWKSTRSDEYERMANKEAEYYKINKCFTKDNTLLDEDKVLLAELDAIIERMAKIESGEDKWK